MKLIRLRFLALGILIALAIIVSAALVVTQVQAQSDVVSEMTVRLTQQGVPVKDIKITTRLPFRVEVEVQSASDSEKATPDDSTFESAIIREAMAARNRHSIQLDTIRITLVNVSGNPIHWSDAPLPQAISSPAPPQMDNTAAAQMIRDQLPLHNMSLDQLDVSSNPDGAQVLTIRLSVQDVQAANNSVPQFLSDLPNLLKNLNSEAGPQIAIYKVNVFDAKAQPLLKYTHDLQLAQETWWQADEMTKDWFPHPPLPSSSP